MSCFWHVWIKALEQLQQFCTYYQRITNDTAHNCKVNFNKMYIVKRISEHVSHVRSTQPWTSSDVFHWPQWTNSRVYAIHQPTIARSESAVSDWWHVLVAEEVVDIITNMSLHLCDHIALVTHVLLVNIYSQAIANHSATNVDFL